MVSIKLENRLIKKAVAVLAAIAMLFCATFFITACGGGGPVKQGTFYSLQQAYNEGLLTVEDLKKIQQFNNDEIGPELSELSNEVQIAIKQSWAYKLRTRNKDSAGATVDNVKIVGYFGSFNDSVVAIMIADDFTDFSPVIRNVAVADVTFTFTGLSIIIWNQK